jgi:L-histidine N-alpha-methyltransferase
MRPPSGTSPASIVEVRLNQDSWQEHLAEATAAGLAATQPWIPPVWFYDEAGSVLFDRITELPEYYLTRAERAILAARSDEIAQLTSATTLAELGSGTSEKTRLLLDALDRCGTLRRVVPFDVSEAVLRQSVGSISEQYPHVSVNAVVGDFHEHLTPLPTDGPCLLAFLGSTIGNLTPNERQGFLGNVIEVLGPDDWFLLGTDLLKDRDRLTAAYDDAAGVTAAFNLNALRVLNRELSADFDPTEWRHRAVFDEEHGRIEMHLVPNVDVNVRLRAIDLSRTFAAGEWIRTEISTKFSADAVADELADAGLDPVAAWTDDNGDFLLTLAQPRGTSAN